MTITIEKTTNGEGRIYYRGVAGKTVAEVYVSEFCISVCCKNAANRVWRGLGRSFETLEDARAGYKSNAMRAIIDEVIEDQQAATA